MIFNPSHPPDSCFIIDIENFVNQVPYLDIEMARGLDYILDCFMPTETVHRFSFGDLEKSAAAVASRFGGNHHELRQNWRYALAQRGITHVDLPWTGRSDASDYKIREFIFQAKDAYPSLTRFVLVTSDAGFIRCCTNLRHDGCDVCLVITGFTSSRYADACSSILSLPLLVTNRPHRGTIQTIIEDSNYMVHQLAKSRNALASQTLLPL